MSDATFYAEQEAKRLRAQLEDLLGFLPFQHIAPVIDAIVGPASPMTTPAALTAAIRKETNWQRHWIAKHEAAQVEIGRLRHALDLTAVERVNRVLDLVADQRPSRTAKHGDDCHERHAACLAARIRSALNGADR